MNRHGRNALFGLLSLAFCLILAIWGRHHFPAAIAFSQYVVVQIKDQPATRTDVLINGQKNGTTGQLIMLGGPGRVFISVDCPKAKQKAVDVRHTTPANPLHVEIDCSDNPASPTPEPNRS
ncbi:MAG TPA: hypothetical protein VEX43_01090 [Chthoniobacterales bacterium]|nr:hypothetical protein [Chthoniobacterales bacterium]